VMGIHQPRNSSHTNKNSLMYMYEIAEETPQQFEGHPSVRSSKSNITEQA
jgi:hypothetical protein